MHILDWSKLIFKFKKLKIQNLFQLVIPNYYPEYLKYHTLSKSACIFFLVDKMASRFGQHDRF